MNIWHRAGGWRRGPLPARSRATIGPRLSFTRWGGVPSITVPGRGGEHRERPRRQAPPAPPAVTSESLLPAFFDYDSYGIRDDARTALDGNAKQLRDNPGVAITIEGHCDERGTVEYNQALGEKRAQAIVAQRARQPFRRPEDVLSVKGLGPAWFAKVKTNLTTGAASPGSATSSSAAPARTARR